jgi:hypothetical protein
MNHQNKRRFLWKYSETLNSRAFSLAPFRLRRTPRLSPDLLDLEPAKKSSTAGQFIFVLYSPTIHPCSRSGTGNEDEGAGADLLPLPCPPRHRTRWPSGIAPRAARRIASTSTPATTATSASFNFWRRISARRFAGNLTYSILDEIRELLRLFKVTVDQGEAFESGIRRWSVGACFVTLTTRQYVALKTEFPRKGPDSHKVLMSFSFRKGWHICFFDCESKA